MNKFKEGIVPKVMQAFSLCGNRMTLAYTFS